MMGLSGLGLDKELGTIMNANRANPAALRSKITQKQRAGITPQLLEVLASQKLIKEKEDAKTALMASQQQNPATIAQQQDQVLRQGAMADLQNEMGIATQVSRGNAITNLRNKRNQTAALQQLTGRNKPRGIAGAPVPIPIKVAQGGIAPRPMMAAQGGPVKFEGGGIIDYIKENPLKSASVGLFLIPGLGAVAQGAGLAAKFGIPFLASAATKALPKAYKFLKSKPGILTQMGGGLGLGVGEYFSDFDEKFGADPVPVNPNKDLLPEIPEDNNKEKLPMQGPPVPPVPSGPIPDSPLQGLPSIPAIQKQADYKPDAVANLGTYLSSFGGGNPAAASRKLQESDFAKQQAVNKANLGIEQQNISNLLAEEELKFNYAKLQEDTNLRENLQLYRSKDSLVQRLNTAVESRRKAEADFETSTIGATIARQLIMAKNKLTKKGKGEEEFVLLQQQYNKLKNAYLAAYNGQIEAIEERLAAFDMNLDQNPVEVNKR